VHNYLIPEGVFVFDINTPHRFEKIYGQNDYVLEDEHALLAWQNDYNEKTKICKFYLSIFEENEDGTYSAAYSKVELSDVFTFKGYSVKENGTAIVASFNVNKELLEIYNIQNNATVVFGSYFTAYEMSNPAIKTELSAKYSVTSTYDLIITEADGDNIDVPFIMAMYIEVAGETSYLSANGVGDATTVQTISLAEALNYPVATKEEE
jgi:hypothetical protein